MKQIESLSNAVVPPLELYTECLRVTNASSLRDLVLGLYNLNMRHKNLSGQGHAHVVLPVIVVPTPQEAFGVFGGHVFNVTVGSVAAVNQLD